METLVFFIVVIVKIGLRASYVVELLHSLLMLRDVFPKRREGEFGITMF